MTKSSGSSFTFDSLLSILSLKSGKPFDPNLLLQIFNDSSVPSSSQITTEDFLSSYTHIESDLKSRVEAFKKQIKDESLKLTNTKRQLIEAKANRIPEDNNVLTITIKSTSLKSPNSIVARVICDDWEVTSNPANGNEAHWDETFTFNPLSHRNIIVELWESEKINLIQCLGRVELKLADLKDEELHCENLKIYNKMQVIGELETAAQWVMVKVDYLGRLVNQIEKALAEERKKFDELEKSYTDFLSPFSRSQPNWFMYNSKFKKAELELSNHLEDLAQKTFGKKVRWPVALEFSVNCYLVLSVVGMMLRPDFVNVRDK